MVYILLLAVVAIVVLLRAKLGRDGGPDVGWAGTNGPAPLAGSSSASAVVARGSAPAVARALGRVESRQLAGSFSFAIGIAFSLFIVVLFGIVWSADFEERWENLWINAPIFAYPLVGMTIVGVHAAVTRERRDGTAELFASCPASPSVRTSGHLRTAWVPVVAIAVFLGLFGLASLWRGSAFGTIPLRTAGDVLAALALGVGGTWLGVALARWAPWWPAPIVAIVVVAMTSTALSGVGEPGYWSPIRQLSTFPRYPDYDLVFAVRPVWWHLGWLLALGAAVAVVAIVRDRRDRPVLIAGGVVAVALLVSGVATSRPLDAHEAERVASMVSHPERHQHCVDRSGAKYCIYEGFGGLARKVADELEPVLAGIPDGVRDRLIVRQGFDARVEELDPEVRERLPKGLPGAGDSDLRLGFSSHPDTFVAARIGTGLWAVGLPSDVGPTTSMESIAGEAPGVVALWIAARGLDLEEALDLASAHPEQHDDGSVDPLAEGMPWPNPCEVGASPVVWAPQDLTAARALLSLPEAEVRRVLDAEWDTLTARTTTTAQLLERFGLPSVGPIDELRPGVWECSY